MKFTILTLFPELVEPFFKSSIMKIAVENGLVEYNIVNIRDFARDKHRTCDSAPFGGGAGMVLKPEPLALALDSLGAMDKMTLYPTPSGKKFTQSIAKELTHHEEIVIICGRYEGIDQRIIDIYVDKEYSVGDFVLSSGEVAALVIIDSIYRLVDGVITGESLNEESFQDNLLEYPHYTRPRDFMGHSVPEILLSGHHKKIEQWRLEERVNKTKQNRPDLLEDERNRLKETKE